MTVTIEVPESLVKQAHEARRPLAEFVQAAVDRICAIDEDLPPGFAPLGRSSMTAAEAGARILELAQHNTLGDSKIRDLIEDGRRI